jgi:hypothetical protein
MVRKILLFFVAIVFAVSAVSKLISVEYFQQFLYSFGILSVIQSIMVARLIIGMEVVIALLLLSQIYQRRVIDFTLLLLLVFSGFILYLEVFTKTDECFCFGTLIQFSNKFSLVKNLVLMVLLFVLRKSITADFQWGRLKRLYLLVGIVVVGVVSGFVVNFPVVLIGQTQNADYCKPCLTKLTTSKKLTETKTVLCFLSTRCKYCKLAAQRIDVMAKKSSCYDGFTFVLWDDDHNAKKFYSDLKIHSFKSTEMNVLEFLDLTKGVMPLIVLYDNGKVVRSYRYADMDEEAILDFLGRK